MAATLSSMASAKITMFGSSRSRSSSTGIMKTQMRKRLSFSVSAEQQEQEQEVEVVQETKPFQEEGEKGKVETKTTNQPESPTTFTKPRPVEKQVNTKSKNMGRDYGGQWLSSVTRHVRIYAAYIDMETFAFDQTQTDKLTLLLDPDEEFLWTPETENKVYSYFQDLVDHYEGAPLTEYTLRLIGSDIEHYIRKLLYDREIQYNMDARVLNFSMGKPRVGFSYNEAQLQDVNNKE